MGKSLLSWLNPLYVHRFVTNRVYARIALRRTLVSEDDRRASARDRGSSGAHRFQTQPEKDAYILSEGVGRWPRPGFPDVILLECVLELSDRDAIVRGSVWSLQKSCCTVLSRISEFGLILCFGIRTVGDVAETPPMW